jgi:dienelactone hydrolase
MPGRHVTRALCALFALALPALAASTAAAALDPVVEAKNYAKTLERQRIYGTLDYQARLRVVSAQNAANALAIQAADPEREFVTDLCWNQSDGCAGDIRLNDWQSKGHGLVEPVLFTARNGATLSGHVWATQAGPSKRPGVVITNGSVQADEQMYWYVAQALAKAGYVVLTWDPQGQGQSDTRGEAPDENEGFPAQTDGRPFFDGTEDALDFFLSTPEHPYVPASSCETGTSHAAKQDRRVAAGLNAAYNPFAALLDGHVGLAGHSYGAAGVSYIGQWDPRVDAIVAWDNLSRPAPGTNDGGFPPGEAGCPAHPEDRTPGTARRSPRCCTPGAGSTPASSSSAAARTWTSRSSPTRPSAPRCAAPNSSRGTRRPGSTSTSRATRPPIAGCSPTAGATTRRRPRSTPTATGTCSPSTTARGLTSRAPTGRSSTARTCAPDAPRSPPTTAMRATTPTPASTARPTANRSRCAARSRRSRSR